jgi:hypothetical protein
MAARKALVRNLDKVVIGQLIDDGTHEPYGTNPMVDEMLRADRRDRFDRYYLGYSNGFTFETVPEVAVRKPAVWDQFLAWARSDGRNASMADKVAKLDSMAGAR